MAAHCPGCQVTAPVTLDADANLQSWIRQFLQSAHPYPAIWPFNPYHSASSDNPRILRRLLHSVRGQIWFSEIGGTVWWRFDGRLIYHGDAFSARVARNIFKLAALSPRITRIFYYHWRSPGSPYRLSKKSTWDAGLVGVNGHARPALLAVAKALHRHLRAGRPVSGLLPTTPLSTPFS